MYLHTERRRDFYAFPEDMTVLENMTSALWRIPKMSDQFTENEKNSDSRLQNASWMRDERVNHVASFCSFPSRIMEHLYLGNFEQANNVEMLAALGITRVLSVGEKPLWLNATYWKTPQVPTHSLCISEIGDNGVDSLLPHIERCLQFIDEGINQKTLVHCQVGVSRSASICIAEVVRRLGVSLEEAYIFTRARRLNVIIQPNLRFMYELLCWSQDEQTRQARSRTGNQSIGPVARTIEWPELAAKISNLNKVYIMTRNEG